MDFDLSPSELAFREEVRSWLAEHLVGEFARYRGMGGTGREDVPVEVLIEWERELATGNWLGLAFPTEVGGRGATLFEQVIFHEEYVRSRAPGRIPNMGVTLLGPTLVAFGTPEQQQRFLPGILSGRELWCQGYSEPNAGSDLANVQTKARLDGGEWVVDGQKIWTSFAQIAQWCFVVARTEAGSSRHAGLSYLLVPMDQPGVEIRPIVQITGGDEFNEVFFDGARTSEDLVVGGVGNGWKVAMGTLGFERGASTLGQQLSFAYEFEQLLELARANGALVDAALRDAAVRSWIELQIMRYSNLRMLTAMDGGAPGPEASVGKLFWSNWHRTFGELAARVRGTSVLVRDEHEPPSAWGKPGVYDPDAFQRTFLYSRAHTIYAGSNEIQRNVLGEQVLGLPKEPRPA
jgi:alkylation response protein AidB-like acyl-CoA dehydrogenase